MLLYRSVRIVLIFFIFVVLVVNKVYSKNSTYYRPEKIKDTLSKDVKDFDINKLTTDYYNVINTLKYHIYNRLKNEKNATIRKELQNINESINLILSQMKILNTYMTSKIYIPIKLPSIAKPPYSLDYFKINIELIKKINLLIKDNKKITETLKEKISAVEENIKTFNLSNIYLKDISEYKKIIELLSLRLQYAIFYVKENKYKYILNSLIEKKEILKKRISKIFKNLDIKKKDIDNINIQLNLFIQKLKNEEKHFLLKSGEIDRKTIYYEIKLQSIQNKILSIGDKTSKLLLRIDSERIKSIIRYYNYQKQYLFQKKLSVELSKIYYEFYKLWITEYINIKKRKEDSLIKQIENIDDKLQNINREILQNIAEIRKAKIELDQKIALNLQQIKTQNFSNIKSAYINLNVQLKKENKLIDNIILELITNEKQCVEILEQTKIVLSLLKDMIGWIRTLNTWSKERFIEIYEKVKFIFFYPIAKFGNLTLSIASIFKVIFSFLLGLISLRYTRKRFIVFLEQKTKLSYGAINSLTTLGYYFSMVLLVLIVLSTAGIDLSQLSILMGALGVGIGFGLQTIANNFISGLIILTDRSIQVGDLVELEDGTIGRVQSLAIRATVIRTFDGKDIIVPNSELISSKVQTWTYNDDWRRLTIPFGVSYDADPEEVRKIAIEAAREVSFTKEDPNHPIEVWFEGLGDSSLNFSLKVWYNVNQLQRMKTGLISDYYFALFKKLKESNIEIPFPQRDINIKNIPEELLNTLKKS